VVLLLLASLLYVGRLFGHYLKSCVARNVQFPKKRGNEWKLLQNMLVRPLSPQVLFPLNMREVKELFPGFLAGDFAVVYDSASVGFLASLLCVRSQLPVQLGGLGSKVIFVDGGNSFRLYQVARLAQLHQLDPQQALERIYISRAFTAYQMVTLITKKLKETVQKFSAKLVVIADIARMFLDKDIPEDEAYIIYRQVTTYLSNFAKENQLIIVATCPPHHDLQRYEVLQSATCGNANVSIALKQTKHRREFVLEKHPCFALGAVEFGLEDLTLADFMAG
jgi:hypothetical protein